METVLGSAVNLLDSMIAIRFLGAVALKAGLLLGVGALLVGVSRPSSAIRHLLRTSALVLVLFLPLAQLFFPAWETDWLPESWQQQLRSPVKESSPPALVLETIAPEPSSQRLSSKALASPSRTGNKPGAHAEHLPSRNSREAAPRASEYAGPWHAGAALLIGHWSLLLVLIWLGGAIYFCGRVVLSLACVRLAVYRSREVKSGGWRQKFDRVALRLGIQHSIRLLVSERTEVALSVGVIRPAVLIPGVARTWSEQRLESIFLHELAHVKRWDNLSNLVCEWACAFYWYNPLVWWTAGKLRVERERACDDQVLATGTRASEYVGHLLEVARAVSSRRLWGHLEVSQSSVLKDRLMAALNPDLDRRLPNLQVKMVTVLVAGALLLPVATFQPWMESRDDVAFQMAALKLPQDPHNSALEPVQSSRFPTLNQSPIDRESPRAPVSSINKADPARVAGSSAGQSLSERGSSPRRDGRSFVPTRILNVERGSRSHEKNAEFRLSRDFGLAQLAPPRASPRADQTRLRFASLTPRAGEDSANLDDLLGDLEDLGPEPQPQFQAVVDKVELGSLGEGESRALAINDAGVVVGQSEVKGGISHPFLWKESVGLQDLGNPRGVHTRAVQVNERGQVLCETFDSSLIMGFVWSEETGLRELGSLDPNFPVTAPQAMNALGTVTGSSRAPDGSLHAFRWTQEEGLRDLGIEGWSEALAINDAGQIVGHADGRAFVWDPEKGIEFLLDETIPLSIATDLNAKGEVVGYAEFAPGIPQAFYWSPTTGWNNLGALSPDYPISLALQINEQSQIVGQSLSLDSPAGDRFARGFRWTAESGMEDIGVALVDAPLAINAVGHIIGTYGESGQQREPLALWLGVDQIQLDPDAESFRDSEVLAVNNNGQIVGSSLSDQLVRRAVLWDVHLEPMTPTDNSSRNREQ